MFHSMHHKCCQTSHSCKADVMKCVFPPCHTDTIVHHCDITPRYFKEHGVLTLGAGQLFHPELPPHYDTPYSWSYGDASDPLNLSLPYVAPGDPAVGTSPLYSNPKALSGCSNTSGEAVEGDMDHWCSINMSRLIEVHPEYVQVHVCLLPMPQSVTCTCTILVSLRLSHLYAHLYTFLQTITTRPIAVCSHSLAALGRPAFHLAPQLGTSLAHLSWPPFMGLIATCNLANLCIALSLLTPHNL
jgi:hypothetical protein